MPRDARARLPAGLFRCGLERPEIAKRDVRKAFGERDEIMGDLRKAGAALAPPLVHVDGTVELELDGVQSARRIAIVLGDETAGIGLVASDRIAEAAHGVLDHVG